MRGKWREGNGGEKRRESEGERNFRVWEKWSEEVLRIKKDGYGNILKEIRRVTGSKTFYPSFPLKGFIIIRINQI